MMPRPLPRALGEALGALVRQYLPDALRQLCLALEQALAEQRLRAFSNEEAQACEHFMRFCRNQQERAIASCVQRICGGLLALPEQAAVLDSRSEWSLVDDEEVDDMLLARRLVRTLRESLGVREWRVCGCFNRLAGEPLADADNPLSFEFLLRQLQAELRLRNQPLGVRALYLSEAGRLLPDLLQPYMQALVEQFAAQRIEPLSAELAPARAHTTPPRAEAASATYQAIQQLRRSQPAASPPAQAAQTHGEIPAALLGRLRNQPVPSGGWTAQALLEQFRQQDCALSLRQQEDTQLVTEVFQHLTQDDGLAPTLKPGVERLLLPVLQAMLKEPAALADSNHPVRATLDRVLRLGDHCEPANPALEGRVHEVIEQIIAGYDGDSRSFAVHAAELDELIDQQQRSYRQNAERVKQLHKGQDTLKQAQRELADALRGLHGEESVPRLLLEWLDAGWRDLLVHELIRLGRQNLTWRLDMSLTGMLCTRLNERAKEPFRGDPEAYAAEVEHQLQVLKRRMEAFGAGSFQYGPVLARLRQQLLGEEPVQLATPEHLPGARPVLADELQRWGERLEQLHEGARLQDANGQVHRLVWKNPAMDHYVLVDRQGRESGCFTEQALVAELASGQLLIEEGSRDSDSLVQRTLQDIVGRLYREVAHARSHDELTGLHNRRAFESALAQSLASRSRHAFLMLHLDQFALINTHSGPHAGDACLGRVSELLRRWLPQASCLARVGGVDFAAVLPGCNEAQAADLAEQVRREVESEGFVWETRKHGITLSVGVVEAAQRHDVANLFCELQSACNAAKEAGRNRVHCFSMASDDSRIGLLAIAARVDDIVEREDLALRVQQIAPTAGQSSELPHYELLLVMQNELQLQDFIAAAERYHRMNKVDRWVLRHIFAVLDRHPDLWGRCSALSINLSGSSLNDDKLLGFIESLFERYRVDPRRICFELTETAAVSNLAKTADLVRHLQRAGCSFSIDDFGVGFSSYDYLKRLPVDYVKIDGSFVREIERSSSDLAMVRSINEIAHALGRQTIAEYVETPAIRARLLEMGVDYVQGYGVQKPVSLEDWLGVAAL